MNNTYTIHGTRLSNPGQPIDLLFVSLTDVLQTETGRTVALTKAEIALFELLCMHPNKAVDEKKLQSHVWRRTGREPKSANSLTVQMSRMKSSLHQADVATLVTHVRNKGYVLNARVDVAEEPATLPPPYRRRNLVFYPSHQQALVDDKPVPLPKTSRRLLTLLATTDGILGNKQILDHIYLGSHRKQAKTASWMISVLRNKILDAGGPDPINVVYGQGYRIWR